MPGHRAGHACAAMNSTIRRSLRSPIRRWPSCATPTGADVAETGSRRGRVTGTFFHLIAEDSVSGFVSFVSAGPGDPELAHAEGAPRGCAPPTSCSMTISPPARSSITPARAPTLVAVGKRAGRPSAKQQHVNRLLVDYAATGVRVVRLKSGDAGIFGRLEEEIEALRAAGIGYEIVPGVTSACAAAAQAGIPLTRRHTSRRVQFVTGADVTGELPRRISTGRRWPIRRRRPWSIWASAPFRRLPRN